MSSEQRVPQPEFFYVWHEHMTAPSPCKDLPLARKRVAELSSMLPGTVIHLLRATSCGTSHLPRDTQHTGWMAMQEPAASIGGGSPNRGPVAPGAS
jgi:hypothetical protein